MNLWTYADGNNFPDFYKSLIYGICVEGRYQWGWPRSCGLFVSPLTSASQKVPGHHSHLGTQTTGAAITWIIAGNYVRRKRGSSGRCQLDNSLLRPEVPAYLPLSIHRSELDLELHSTARSQEVQSFYCARGINRNICYVRTNDTTVSGS